MAFNVLSQPSETQPTSAWHPVVFEVEDTTNTGEAKFRYVCRIKDGSTVLAILKLVPNANDIAVFDISTILRDYITQTRLVAGGQSVVLAGDQSNQLLEVNTGDVKSFLVDLGVSYAADADSAPSITYSDSNNAVRCLWQPGNVVGLKAYEDEVQVWAPVGGYKTLPICTGGSAIGLLTERYQATSTSTLFGTADAITIEVLEDAPLPMAALVADNSTYDFESRFGQLQVKVLDGSLATQTATFVPGADGEPGDTYDATNSDDEVLLFFGLGRAQLVQQVDQGVPFNGAIGSASTWQARVYDTNGTTARSLVYIIQQLDDRCFGGSTFQVYWRNRFGGIDTLPMSGKNTQQAEVKRETYQQLQGNVNTASTSVRYGYNQTEGGTTVFRTEMHRKLQLMTKHLREWDSRLIESLVASREVWLYSSELDEVVAATCTDNSVPFKRYATDNQFTYTLNFELAHKQHA